MQMTEKECKRWQRAREKGRKNYIWRTGVFGFGLILATMCLTLDFSIFGCIKAILIGPLVGYGWGYLMWKYMEKYYQQAMDQKTYESIEE